MFKTNKITLSCTQFVEVSNLILHRLHPTFSNLKNKKLANFLLTHKKLAKQTTTTITYSDFGFGEACPSGYFLPCGQVGVSIASECGLQLLQLLGREVGALASSSLFFAIVRVVVVIVFFLASTVIVLKRSVGTRCCIRVRR
jgi:hypothetical protein